MHDHKQLDTRRRSCVGTTVWLPLSSPIISTEAEGVGRAWTLPSSLFHLHRGRGSLEGPGSCLASATHSALISSSQQWAQYHQCHTGVLSMAPSCSTSLLLTVKVMREGCYALSSGRRHARRLGITTLGAPHDSSFIHNQHGAMAEQFLSECEFFQILPDTHSILWIPTGAPMLLAPEKGKGPKG